jgi:hypothetical protein
MARVSERSRRRLLLLERPDEKVSMTKPHSQTLNCQLKLKLTS